MNNLQDIIVGLAVITIIISIWAIQYFIARIIYVLRYRWDEREHLREEGLPDNYSPIVKSHSTKEELAYRVKSK